MSRIHLDDGKKGCKHYFQHPEQTGGLVDQMKKLYPSHKSMHVLLIFAEVFKVNPDRVDPSISATVTE